MQKSSRTNWTDYKWEKYWKFKINEKHWRTSGKFKKRIGKIESDSVGKSS